MAVSVVIYSEGTYNTHVAPTKLEKERTIMKKKLLTITLSLMLVLSLVACGGEDKPADTSKDKTIETANSNDEATKDKEKTEEKEPEIAPVVEAEDEVEEEVEEEKVPTTTEEIRAYLLENGEPGDFIISDEDIVLLKTQDNYVYQFQHPVSMNGEMYFDNTFDEMTGSKEVQTFNELVEKAYSATPDLSAEKDDALAALVEQDRGNEQAIVLRRVEPTDDPDKVKVTLLMPNGDLSFFPPVKANTYERIICVLSCHTTPEYYMPYVNPADIENNKISFIVDKNFAVSPDYIKNIPVEKQTADVLTILSYFWDFQVAGVSASEAKNLGLTFIDYELVD